MLGIYHVDEIIKEMGNGITNPLLASVRIEEAESNLAVIKTLGNNEGPRVLFNEYCGYKCAVAVGLTMPPSGMAIIDKDTRAYDGLSAIESHYGPCFYSTLVSKVGVINQGVIGYASNKDEFENIILFDHFVYNKDRNRGNLLLSNKKNDKTLYVIDHSHIFKNAAIWDRYSCQRGQREEDFTETEILEANQYMYGILTECQKINRDRLFTYAQQYKAIITREFLEDCISDIPVEWMVPNEDIEALLEYLLYRIDHIGDICKIILEYQDRR